jgi:hypothetical protein
MKATGPLRRIHMLAVAGSPGMAAFAQACGDGPTPPADPTLRVSVRTTGVDFDPDGYVLQGGEVEWEVDAAASITVYRVLAPGSYQIRLDGLAANCGFDGPDVVPVTITEGRLSSVSFQVQCTATTGAFQISAPTSGRDYRNASYFVELDGEGIMRSASVRPDQTVTMKGLPGGTYELAFGSRAENCAVIGRNPQTATITVGTPAYQTTALTFTVQCSATTGDVHLVTATTGESVDVNGYTVFRDGQEIIVTRCDPADFYCYNPSHVPLRLDPDAEWSFTEVTPATYSYELRDLAANCVVNGSNPRSVAVAVGETAEVVFDVACSRVP